MIAVQRYDRDRDTDVHAFHTSIRAWQVATGQVQVFGDDNDDLHRIGMSYLFSGGGFWVARDGDRLVGCIGLQATSPVTGTVKRLAVHPDYHRQGIATRLLWALITDARRKGFHSLRLATGDTENARPLYERAGFRVDGWVNASGDHLMSLDLRAAVRA